MTTDMNANTERDIARAPIIAARGLTKRYGNVIAVRDLDLDIQPGEVFGLLGPNGAGKTTTILMLLGLTEPTAGTVTVAGLDPTRHALHVKATVGYLPDSVGFYEHLSGRQNLAYTAALNRLSAAEASDRIDEVLERTGLSDVAARKVGGYSRGMRQRLGLADALIKRPSVLILDEPTVNIDPAGVDEILNLVRNLAEHDNVAVLLSSHLLHQVQAICDRIGIFVNGELVATGPISELAEQFDDPIVIEVATTADPVVATAAIKTVPGVTEINAVHDQLHVTADHDIRADLADTLHDHGCTLTHLRLASAELDSIYRRYFATARLTQP